MGQKSLEERQAEMKERLTREKLGSIGERIVADAVRHTPAEPLPTVLAPVNWSTVLAGTEEPEIPVRRQKAPPIEARLFNLQEAAFYLGVSTSSVREFTLMGALPTVKLPSRGQGTNVRIFIDVRDLHKFVDDHKERRDAKWWRRQ
jgi:hypothetical protein